MKGGTKMNRLDFPTREALVEIVDEHGIEVAAEDAGLCEADIVAAMTGRPLPPSVHDGIVELLEQHDVDDEPEASEDTEAEEQGDDE